MSSKLINGWTMLLAVIPFALLTFPQEVTAQQTKRNVQATQQKSVIIGKLIRAGRTRNGKPKFGLLDEQGNLTSHVVPISGLNLAKFTNQQVGITVRSAARGKDNLPFVLAQSATQFVADKTPTKVPAAVPNETVWEFEDSDLELNDTAIVQASADESLQAAEFDMPEVINRSAANVQNTTPSIPESIDAGILLDEVVVEDVPIGAAVLRVDHELPIQTPTPAIPIPSAAGHSATIHPGTGEFIPGETIIHDSPGIGGCNTPGCTSCGDVASCLIPDACPCGPAGRYWVRADYVMWWTKGMDLPDLITTSPSNTSAENAGVRGQDGTSVLFGGDEALTDARNGARFRFGKWCDACQWIGFEGEYFFIGEESDGFSQTSTGAPILARPFFNTSLNQEDSELIAFPGIVSGQINADLMTELHSFSPRFRFNLRCMNFCTEPAMACGPGNGCGGSCCNLPGGQRLDFTLGYRYVNLEEMLSINEQLATDQNGVLSTFNVTDSFKTENDFHGVDLGLQWERYRGAWSLELLGRVALGNTSQRVEIAGSTVTNSGGVSFSDAGGILALQSNSGQYENDTFSAIPEVGASLGYRIGPSLRFMLGYTFLYWSDVVRPGDQIDLNVNPDLIPPVQTTTGPDSPAFVLNETDFWAQGLSFGLDYRW